MAPRNCEESDAHGHAALEADAADPAATAAPPACATASEVVAPGSLKKWVFIVNPASGSGSTGKKWPRMLQRFKDAATSKGWSHVDEVAALMTTRQGEATELTRTALREGAATVVAVGGDGSLAEVVEGFFEPDSHDKVSQTANLAFLPHGTGGDFRCAHDA